MSTALQSAAFGLTAAGLSVLPIGSVADKRPAPALLPLGADGKPTWLPFQHHIATQVEMAGWFGPAAGIAVVAGAVSGNLTIMDFDTKVAEGADIYDRFAAEVGEIVPGLLDRLPLIKTQSGGRHLYFRCAVCGRPEPLALAPNKQAWIETKAEGGYCLAPRTPGYETLRGTLTDVPTISPEERAFLFAVARSLSTHIPQVAHDLEGEKPGAAFNVKMTIDDMEGWLLAAGWRRTKTRSDGTRELCRPGKEGTELSATLGQGGLRTLYVFSSSCAPFEQNTGYTAFSVYAHLKHGGEHSAAARELAANGFGGGSARARGNLAVVPEPEPRETPPPEEEWYVSQEKEALAALEPSMLLAPSLVAYVSEARQASGFPLEFLIPCVLAATAACIGATAKVKIASTWTDSAVLWIGFVGRPGSGKTPSLNLGIGAVRNLQAAWYRAWKAEMATHEEAVAEWERTDRKRRDKKPEPPRARRILTSDTTIEALVPLLENNPRGLLLERDELAGWIKSFNQYKKNGGADREHWLSMWSSTPLIVDRKGDAYFAYVQDPFVAVVGGIQPGKIRGLVGGEDDGFSDRLLLFYPEAAPHGINDAAVSPETLERFTTLLAALGDFSFDTDAQGLPIPHLFHMDPEARKEFSRLLDRMVQAAMNEDISETLANAYTKAGSHAARLALVLHLAQCFDNCPIVQDRINTQTVQAAWAVVDVAMSHLRRIHAELAVTPQDLLIERVTGWIKRNGGAATVRQMMRGHCPGAKTASGSKSLLYQLEDRRLGTVAVEKPPHGSEQVTFRLGGNHA